MGAGQGSSALHRLNPCCIQTVKGVSPFGNLFPEDPSSVTIKCLVECLATNKPAEPPDPYRLRLNSMEVPPEDVSAL